jgi:hypothetical protein
VSPSLRKCSSADCSAPIASSQRSSAHRLRPCSAAGKPRVEVVIEGNHEERLAKFLRDQAPELDDLPGLTVERLLEIPSRPNVEYVGPYGAGIDWHSVHIYHGRYTGTNAGRRELASRWTSGISGHTQRLSATYFTDGFGVPHAWFEDGAMTIVEPGKMAPARYRQVQPDWQQGLVIGEAEGDNWNVEPIAMYKQQFVRNGRLYTPES